MLPGDWAIARLVNHVTTSGIFALTVAVLCFVKIGDRPIMDFRSVSSSSVKMGGSVYLCSGHSHCSSFDVKRNWRDQFFWQSAGAGI